MAEVLRAYSGNSMRGTFRFGDLLVVLINSTQRFRVGDVIVFSSAADKPKTAHRIIRIHSTGFITKGDYNLKADNGIILPKNVEGRVIACIRKGNRHSVSNGIAGRLRGFRIALRRKISIFLFNRLRGLYILLKKSELIRKIWNPGIIQLALRTDHGQVVKYIHKNKVVAIQSADGGVRISKPYDLLLKF